MMLPPAHNAVLDLRAKRLSMSRYYEPRYASRRVKPDEFRMSLRKAVERRMVSDVPVSISLSSGTDSSSVAALMAQLTTNGIMAFTTATEKQIGDESALVARFVAHYPQFELKKSSLSEASSAIITAKLFFTWMSPSRAKTSSLGIANLTMQHRRKVLLNGEGADGFLAATFRSRRASWSIC